MNQQVATSSLASWLLFLRYHDLSSLLCIFPSFTWHSSVSCAPGHFASSIVYNLDASSPLPFPQSSTRPVCDHDSLRTFFASLSGLRSGSPPSHLHPLPNLSSEATYLSAPPLTAIYPFPQSRGLFKLLRTSVLFALFLLSLCSAPKCHACWAL